MTSSDPITPVDDSVAGHLTAAFHDAPAELVDGELPYHDLGGAGLERLTFLLLAEDHKVPQYFGKNGEPQYGIDLLVPDGDRVTVYQCKNYTRFSRANLRGVLEKFRDEWLSLDHLPRPDVFVVCCPLDLRTLAVSEEWERMRKEFRDDTGVSVEIWHRDYFDERLRKSPDLVADVFSERGAGDFCHPLSWRYDVFRPLHPQAPPDIFLDGYHRLCRDGHLVLHEERAEAFKEVLLRDGTILVQGAPGTGKTTTVLALAETLGVRVFYVNVRRCSASEDVLVEGIERRLTRPTVFVFDDCQEHLDELASFHYRASRILRGRGWLVLVARTAPAEGRGLRFDASELEDELAEAGSVVIFKNDMAFFKQVVERRRPDLVGLSEQRAARLFEHSARDFAILDAVLDAVEGPSDIDSLDIERLYEKTLKRYFGNLPSTADRLFDLAALAQFELAPPSDWLSMDNLRQEAPRVEALVSYAGHPPRGYFVHASAGELIGRALAWVHGRDYEASTVASVLRFLNRPQALAELRTEEISTFLGHRLRIADQECEACIRGGVLAEDRTFSLIEQRFASLPLKIVAICLADFVELSNDFRSRYRDLVGEMTSTGVVLEMLTAQPFWNCVFFLQLTRYQYPSNLARLREQILDSFDTWADRVDVQTFFHVLGHLSSSDDERWKTSVTALSDKQVDDLVQRHSGRSIGTLNLALRKLRKVDEDLLVALEEKIGERRYLDLILALGTIFEFFKALENSTPSMAGRLIEALTEGEIDRLHAQTIASGRSIGTLHLAFGELKKVDENLLVALEEKIGERRYLDLILALGTIFELFKALEHSTPSMAGHLIAALTESDIDRLHVQTIASGRSIGTLHLALRELKKVDEDLLVALEEKIGEHRYLDLILALGTIFELFRFLQCSTPSMTGRLIAALTESDVDRLHAQTIASGHSIGTLHLALRELKKVDLLVALEEKIGERRYLDLTLALGTIFELFKALENSTPSMAGRLIEALTEGAIDQLHAQTIASGRSIGTLNMTLHELKKVDEDLLVALEEKIGECRYLDLILALGTMFEFFTFLRDSTPSMAGRLIAALTEADVDQLHAQTIASRRSIGTLNLALRELKKVDEDLLVALEEKIGECRYLDLILALGTMFELFTFLRDSTPSMAGRLIAALTEADVDRLHAQTIASGRSIGTLNLALRELKKVDEDLLVALEEKIGVQRVWVLILESGDIAVLGRFSQYSSWHFGQRLLTTFVSASADIVAPWLLRSGVLQVCQILRWSGFRLSKTDSGSFVKRLRPTLLQLIEQADWPTRARAAYQLANASPSKLKDDMTSLFWDYLQPVDPAVEEPEALSDFLTFVGHLGAARPSVSQRAFGLVERHFGLSDGWPQTPGFIHWSHAFLNMLSNPDAPAAMARELLGVASGREVASLLLEASTLDVLIYLWNLYALWFQWQEGAEDFREAVHRELRDAAVRVLLGRATTPEDDHEPFNWLVLAGVLSFTGLAEDAELKSTDLSVLPSSDALARWVKGADLAFSALAVLGSEACTGRRCDATLRRKVVARFDSYQESTAAMRFLRVALASS